SDPRDHLARRSEGHDQQPQTQPVNCGSGRKRRYRAGTNYLRPHTPGAITGTDAELLVPLAQLFGVFLNMAAELNETLEVVTRARQLRGVDCVWILDDGISDKAPDLFAEFYQRILNLRVWLQFY